MKRVLSMLCIFAMLLGMITVPAFAESEAGVPGNTLVLSENAENLIVEADTYLDLNGYSVAGVTVNDGATLYVCDSQTDDYTVADGVYGKITGITGDVQAAEGYLAITEEEAVSFHKVDLSLKSMALRPAVAGVYYNSSFASDEVVAANTQCYGVALSIVEAPTAENLETLCGYSVIPGFASGEKSGTLLTGIMSEANTAEENAENAGTPVYGSAYIKTADGYVFGTCVSRDLQEQVEAIDAIFGALTETQKSGIQAMYETYKAAMEDWNIPNLRANQLDDTVINVPVQAENGVVTETVTVEENGISVTVPFGALVDKAELTLQVTKKAQSDSGIEANADQTLMPFDIHMDGISSENTVPLTVALGKVMPENLNLGNYSIYHVEETGTKEMDLVAMGAEFTAHNQYKYTLEGELTLYMATFSEVAVVSETENIWNGTRNYDWYDADATTLYIRNADQLAGFGAIVGNMASADGKTIAQDSFEGKTVTLLADISIGDLDSENSYVFYPIGYWNNQSSYEKCYGREGVSSGFYAFQGTFDGNGNTISDFYQNTWEMVGDYNDGYSGTPNYYRDGMGLFGKVYGGTVKNLTVRNFSCDSEHGTSGTIAAYADCGALFENISIFDCNPRVYNIGNGGIVGCSGWYAQETAENKVVFRNISVDQSNKISALWDATGTSAGGILGQYYPTSGQSSAGYPENPGILFENCHTAAIIEVNNDCCSNYHYYWYRYAGMLMGSVRKNTKDANGYTVADTTGITAVGCTYTYGNWNEYWYCELVKNTIASYTHDHQFGRLTSITDLSEITNDEGKTWLKEGNFALLDENRDCLDCYHIFKDSSGNLYRHFHDVADETNPNIYETFDLNGDGELNDLKEDRQRYYIPFGQLFTGDGMGIKAHHEFPGVTEEKNGVVRAHQKFQVKEGADLAFLPGETVKLSDIVELTEFGESKLTQAFLYAAASPVTEEDTVNVTYYQNVVDWTNNTITFSEDSFGLVKLVLTDYFYCEPTVVYVSVGEDAVPAVKFEAASNVKGSYTTGTTLTLSTLFAAVSGMEDEIQQGKVQVTVSPATEGSTAGGTYTPNATDWTKGKLKLTGYGSAKITITDYYFCIPTELTLYVDISDEAVNDYAVKMDFEALANADGIVSATCPACVAAGDDGIKAWTPMPETYFTKSDGNHYHYYLDADKTYSVTRHYLVSNGTKMCLNLNGQTITSTARTLINDSSVSCLNVMGKGLVQGTVGTYMTGNKNYSGLAIDAIGPVNLYGGTYSAVDGVTTGSYRNNPIVSVRGTSQNAVLKMYKDVKVIRDEADAPGWCVFVSDRSTMYMYGGEISGGSAHTHEYIEDLGAVGGNIVMKVRSHDATAYSCGLLVYGGKLVGKPGVFGSNIAVIGTDALAKSKASITIRDDAQILGGSVRSCVTNTSISLRDNPVIDDLDLSAGHKLTLGAVGAMDVKITAPVGAVVSGILDSDAKLASGKYFESTIPGCDVTVVGNVLQVTDDVCPHCDTANAEITWESLTSSTISSLIKKCSESSYYYFPTGHYRMDGDISRSSQLFIGDFKGEKIYNKPACDVVLDLNGYTYTASNSKGNRVFYMINEGSALSILDSSEAQTGTIDGNYTASGAAIFAKSGTTLNIYSGTLKWRNVGGYAASGVVDLRGATLNLYGGTLKEADVKTSGGTVYATVDTTSLKPSTVNIYGGTVEGGNATVGASTTNQYGGSICVMGSNLNVYGGEIQEGTAKTNGDTIYAGDTKVGTTTYASTVNLMGGTIIGQIYATNTTAVTVGGTSVITDLDLTNGTKINLGEVTDGADITVNVETGTEFSAPNENAELYRDYFHATDRANYYVAATQNGTLAIAARVLEAGFGRVSITPDYEVLLGGGAATRMATECKDDLSFTCVALREGGHTYLVCTMDLITSNDNFADPAREAMSAATGVPVENILLNATHTHASVAIRAGTKEWDNCARYRQDFYNWATQAAVMAMDDLAVATVSYGSTQAPNLAWVRHYLMSDGTYCGSNFGSKTSQNSYVSHTREADTEMQLIRFSRATKDQDVVMMNFGCHATYEEQETVMSADFPYYFRKYVEEHDTVDESGNAIAGAKDVLCAYFIAAAGDQVHVSRITSENIVHDYEAHGNALGEYAVALLRSGNMTTLETVGSMFTTKTFTGNRYCPTEDLYNKALEVKSYWDTLEGGRASTEGRAKAREYGFGSIYHVSAVISNYEAYQKNTTLDMELRVMSVGDVGLIFAPYEMFGSEGLTIKEDSPFKMTFVVSCAQGAKGYLPSHNGWEIGTYESHVTHYVEGTAETLAEEFVAMLTELKEQQSE